MPKQIYVLTSEEDREIVRDALFSRKISELNREKGIDTLFLDLHKIHPPNYPLLRSYCQSNETANIEIIDLIEKDDFIINDFKKIYRYSKKYPQKDNLAYITEQEDENGLERLVEFLKQEFQVEEIELASGQENTDIIK